MRQAGILTGYDPKRGVSVATLAYEYPSEYRVPEHAHGADQLIYAIGGVMEVRSGSYMWLIPPSFAIWVPAKTLHRIHMRGQVAMRTLYLRPRLLRPPRPEPAVLHLAPLLRELILETVRIGSLRAKVHHERALRDLLVLHLQIATSVPTFVVLPTEKRALAVAHAVLEDLGQAMPLATLARDAGASVRTVQRLFRKELGIDFEAWRRQVRLTKAVELLIGGRSVKEVAYSVGYQQPSAFVETFRRSFGMTPKAWILSLEKPGRAHTEAS